jgi:hypothetical protein
MDTHNAARNDMILRYGHPTCFVTVEHQSRGAPHDHFLLWSPPEPSAMPHAQVRYRCLIMGGGGDSINDAHLKHKNGLHLLSLFAKKKLTPPPLLVPLLTGRGLLVPLLREEGEPAPRVPQMRDPPPPLPASV